MNDPHITALTNAHDALCATCDRLRDVRDSSPDWLDAWTHACKAHTETCMALDAARAAGGVFRTMDDDPDL